MGGVGRWMGSQKFSVGSDLDEERIIVPVQNGMEDLGYGTGGCRLLVGTNRRSYFLISTFSLSLRKGLLFFSTTFRTFWSSCNSPTWTRSGPCRSPESKHFPCLT